MDARRRVGMTYPGFAVMDQLLVAPGGAEKGGLAPFDLLRACFPAGTVAGAPKIRAMQLVSELEAHRRGPYAGAVGYALPDGTLDTCIAIRTIIMSNGKAYVQAGAGIVIDSNPTAEYEETRDKARALLTALEIAHGGL